MSFSKKLIATCAGLLLALALPLSAAADTLEYSFTQKASDGKLSFDFTLPSNPTPDDGTNNFFEIRRVAVTGTLIDGTSFSGTYLVEFNNVTLDGGLAILLRDFNLDLDGPKLYTGSETSPTLSTGSFQFTGTNPGDDPKGVFPVGTLRITDLSITTTVTPEPSSFALLGTGALGLVSLVRRKVRMPGDTAPPSC